MPQAVRHWTLTTLRAKLIKIGRRSCEKAQKQRHAPIAKENRGRIGKKDWKKSCKHVEQEEHHENAHAGREREIKWKVSV